MAAAGLATLFRSCVDSFKSILTSQEFGAEYELLCSELSLSVLRFRLWGNSVGMSEGSHALPSSIINRLDLRPTIDQAVGSIKYLLDEVDDLRRKYQLNQLDLIEEASDDKVKRARSSKSRNTLSAPRFSFSLRQRIRENQKQKSFLAIAKWALCDARKFHEKVTKLKCLIDGLEIITKTAGVYGVESNATPVLEDNPPPYCARESIPQRPGLIPQPDILQVQRLYLGLGLANVVPPGEIFPGASRSALANHLVLERYLSVYPDESSTPRPAVRQKLLALTMLQFEELSQDVHDELLRRQRFDSQTPEWLPPCPLFHPMRNVARKQLATIFHFRHLVSDIVFEFERRIRLSQESIDPESTPGPSSPNTRLENPPRFSVYDPPPRLQYRKAHHSTHINSSFISPMDRASVPESVFNEPQSTSDRAEEPLRFDELNKSGRLECFEATHWSMDRVLHWLAANDFSIEWQRTIKALNICGAVFLALRDSRATGTMYLLVYPRLTVEYGSGWDETKAREEGKRLRRLVRRLPFPEPKSREPSKRVASSSTASVEIFKSFRVSIEDPCHKVLPAALRKYNINAPWEQYALYIVYGDKERCLGRDEKPLILFKQLNKEGQKPMFMLRRIASRSMDPAAVAKSIVTNSPGGII